MIHWQSQLEINSQEKAHKVMPLNLIVTLLFEVTGGIQGRTLHLDFSKFDGLEPTKWILKVQ